MIAQFINTALVVLLVNTYVTVFGSTFGEPWG